MLCETTLQHQLFTVSSFHSKSWWMLLTCGLWTQRFLLKTSVFLRRRRSLVSWNGTRGSRVGDRFHGCIRIKCNVLMDLWPHQEILCEILWAFRVLNRWFNSVSAVLTSGSVSAACWKLSLAHRDTRELPAVTRRWFCLLSGASSFQTVTLRISWFLLSV